MPIGVAYIFLVLIWSTTPLAIKWGLEEISFMQALVLRMALGTVLITLLAVVLRQRFVWRHGAWKTYVIAGLGMTGAMSLVYWGTQYISSGLLSVIGGMGPIVTGIFATLILKERVFTRARSGGLLLGLLGMVLIFHSSFLTQINQAQGVIAVLLSSICHSLSAVLIKHWRAPIQPLALATGALWVAMPCYLVLWWLSGAGFEPIHDVKTLGAITYLAVLGSVFGFVTYYFLIQNISAHHVALVSLITPPFAIAIGRMVNAETWQVSELVGAAFILLGLALYQSKDS